MRDSDWLPGIVASAAFVAITALFGPSMFWLSILCGLGVYLGLRWMRQPTKEPSYDFDSALASIQDLGAGLPVPSARQACVEICQRTQELRKYLQKNPSVSDERALMLPQYLELVRNGLTLYNSSSGGSKERSLQTLQTLLQEVRTRFASLQDNLNKADDQALAGEIGVLTKTLKDLDEVCLTLGGETR